MNRFFGAMLFGLARHRSGAGACDEATVGKIDDRMLQDYRYQLVVPMGGNFHSEFLLQLTPMEMLALGVFGGKYMTDCRSKFPQSWFAQTRLSPEECNPAFE